MPYSDPIQKRVQDSLWRYQNRDRWNKCRRELRTQRKYDLLRDRKCADCSESDVACLDFHYRNEATKEIDLKRRIREPVDESLLKEIDKCDVLCGNCNKRRRRKLQTRKTSHIRKHTISSRIAALLRTRLCLAVKHSWKSGSAVKDLGCTINDFRSYIEEQFQPGMSWDNWSRTGWHLDHKIPLASFNLENRDEFLQAVHYTNIQPLWAAVNIRKGKKITTPIHASSERSVLASSRK